MVMAVMTVKAGRALDADVAEKVMGLTVREGLMRLGYYEMEPEILDVGDEPIDGMEHEEVLIVGKALLPHYSTDIAAAWQVVEKADEFEMWNHTGKSYGCRLTFRNKQAFAKAATAPLAICRAALDAVG